MFVTPWKGPPTRKDGNQNRFFQGAIPGSREVIAAYGAAMVATFQVPINCLEESDALLPGAFPDALGG
jgi:hypothetical protein